MLTLRPVLAVAGATLLFLAPPPLRVLRVTPSGDASPGTEVTVTFDRPVAGSLDQTVDARRIFRIDPAVPGRLEWRDPVTIRFLPAQPLRAATTYTVTVADSFAAMDQSRLEGPYRFSFRVRGPRPVGGRPARPAASNYDYPRHLRPTTTFDVLFTSAVDLAALSSAAYVELSTTCQGERVIRLRATGQRPLGERDDWQLREAG